MENNTDYSEACIYMLKHKSNNNLLKYVGSTVDRINRLRQHEGWCNNSNYPVAYNRNIYKYIRKNNGFNNWIMTIIEEYPCDENTDELNDLKLRKREQYWINFYDSKNNGLNEKNAYTSEEERKEYLYDYNYTDKGKERTQKYENIDKAKETRIKYYNSDKGKLNQQKKYENYNKNHSFIVYCKYCNSNFKDKYSKKHYARANHKKNIQSYYFNIFRQNTKLIQ
tara:strand:+ start:561 stop:1232 length:672 start_codon:yes stop_codon:yes gene_type:complete